MTAVRLELDYQDYKRLDVSLVPTAAKRAIAIVPALELVRNFEILSDFTEVNPRVPKRKRDGVDLKGSSTINRMLETIREEPQKFFDKNKGVTLLVKSVHKGAGSKEKKLFIYLDTAEKELYGVADGYHTLSVLNCVNEYFKAGDYNYAGKLDQVSVTLHLLEDFSKDDACSISEGLNTAVAVKEKDIQNLRGNYEKIKASFIAAGFDANSIISFKTGDREEGGQEKPVDIVDLIHITQLFNGHSYDTDRKVKALISKRAQALKDFVASLEEDSDVKYMESLIQEMPKIAVLFDELNYIMTDSSKGALNKNNAYTQKQLQSEDRRGKSGNKNYHKHLYFAKKEAKADVAKGFSYPIISAFRACASIKGGLFCWVADPLELVTTTNIVEELHSILLSYRVEEGYGYDDISKDLGINQLLKTKVQQALMVHKGLPMF